jgi:membrane protease YdiL (CAAX protease family)
MAAVLAPVAEELVFRGVALPVLARHLGVVPALLLTSMVFAAIHFHPEAVVPLFVAAACFGAAYAVTGRLVVAMVMHGLFNSVNLVVLLGGGS